MFSKLALFAAASFAVFVAALPQPGSTSVTNGSCNPAGVQCCNSVQSAQSQAVQGRAEALNILDQIPAAVPVGVNCTPLSILALSGEQCSQQTVCCTGNSFSGALVVGCSPINANV